MNKKKLSKSHPIVVILASGSPRRQEVLRELGIDFEIHVPDVNEIWKFTKNAREIARELAIKKARKCRNRKELVIAMDTLVVIDEHRLGKPKDPAEAREMLQLLSGRTHRVITGVALIWKGRLQSGTAVTKVRFRKILAHELDWYIGTMEPFDKAGAYAIQGFGRIFIDSIEGCYFNVVGFPVALFQRLLRRFQLTIKDLRNRQDAKFKKITKSKN